MKTYIYPSVLIFVLGIAFLITACSYPPYTRAGSFVPDEFINEVHNIKWSMPWELNVEEVKSTAQIKGFEELTGIQTDEEGRNLMHGSRGDVQIDFEFNGSDELIAFEVYYHEWRLSDKIAARTLVAAREHFDSEDDYEEVMLDERNKSVVVTWFLENSKIVLTMEYDVKNSGLNHYNPNFIKFRYEDEDLSFSY